MKPNNSNRLTALTYELKINKWYKGKHVATVQKDYDIETKNLLIEVKSANLINKSNKLDQLGRYQIITDNHITLFLKAIQKNKKAIYVFCLKIGKRFIFKQLNWEDITINNNKDYNYITLNEVFMLT